MSLAEYRLAALATAAVQGLSAVAARMVLAQPDCDAADVNDSNGKQWRVRLPRNDVAAKRLEHEVSIWQALNASDRLPFKVPNPAGFADTPQGYVAVVYERLTGSTVDVHALTPEDAQLPHLTRALAALHKVPATALRDVDIPRFSAGEYRLRRVAELTAAADTGYVPTELVQRWHEALSPSEKWDFAPTVVHGDLVADHVLLDGVRVGAIVEWSETKIADPADDLAWLLASAPEPVSEKVLELYLKEAPGTDDHIMWRAKLAGELSVARWMLYGISSSNRDIVTSARKILRELARDVAAGRLV